jgi:heptosyltransferase-3
VQILILHPGGLGDIILSLPAITLLRSAFPAASFTIAGNIDHLSPIVSGYAEHVVSLSTLPLHHMYSCGELTQEEVRFWKSFDRIVSWTGSGDKEFVRNMAEIHPNARVAQWKPEPGDSRHVAQLFVDSLGLPIQSGRRLKPARIFPDFSAFHSGRRWLIERGWSGSNPLVALHAGAGSERKRWPLSRFIGLAQKLMLQKEQKLLLIEGPAEPGLAEQMAQALQETEIIRVESVSLGLLAGILQNCRAFVGNDSGLAHMAAALEIPSVVLFGPTLPQHWAPLGQHVVVLRDPHGCEACASGGNDHTCLNNITIEDVIRNSRLLQ